MKEGDGAGKGSKIEYLGELLEWVPQLIERYKIKKINDAGCGRQVWIPEDRWGVDYRGYDGHDYGNNIILDISKRKMRKADLIICKDVFRHMEEGAIRSALALFDAPLLLADSDSGVEDHHEANTPIDMHQFLGDPLDMVESSEHENKYFGLWGLADA